MEKNLSIIYIYTWITLLYTETLYIDYASIFKKMFKKKKMVVSVYLRGLTVGTTTCQHPGEQCFLFLDLNFYLAFIFCLLWKHTV